jgi:hypothetical protein
MARLGERESRQAASGDPEAQAASFAIQRLVAPLESLQQAPWPERLAALS